jgi:Sterol-sensing domain of SREBP cleavage-activation
LNILSFSSQIDAAYKTSVALPVKERIAEGLGRAGTSNTFKLVSYNTILGTFAFFSVGAIRQFCAFAIVVLVAHWFLVHTFFVAVLSIDMQRLEVTTVILLQSIIYSIVFQLDELLQQGTTLAPSTPQNPPQAQVSTRWRKTLLFTRNLLHSRANKNISLVLVRHGLPDLTYF